MISQIPPYRATSSSSSAPAWLTISPFCGPVPDLAFWSSYLRNGGDPNRKEVQEVFGDSLVQITFQGLYYKAYNDQLREFSEFVDLLLNSGADLNEVTDECVIDVNDDEAIFSNVTCLHILYLFWKLGRWNHEQDDYLEKTFDRMINDPRMDLRATFSEEYNNCGPDWDFCGPERDAFDTNFADNISRRSLVEDATLLHYAAMSGDAQTIDKLLVRDPELIHLHCFTVSSKNLIEASHANEPIYPLIERPRELGVVDDTITGCLGHPTVVRQGRITALHLAAKAAKGDACLYLVGRGAYRGAEDEGCILPEDLLPPHSTPLDYLERAYKGWISEDGIGIGNKKFNFISLRKFKKLQSLLKFIPQIPKSLPQPYLWRHFDGYSILYDARAKVPMCVYECLTSESLKMQTKRTGLSFTQDHEIPAPNRSKATDYAKSGYQKGHGRPAANARDTAERMRETFKYSNVFVQDPTLNMGLWKKLEETVRTYVPQNGYLELFTGGLNQPTIGIDGKKRVSYEVIGGGHVAVPSHLYKVLFLRNGLRESSLAYLFPNEPPPPGKGVDSFRVSVDTIQGFSGILFSSWVNKEVGPTGFRILPTIEFEIKELGSQVETLTLYPEFQLEDGRYQPKPTDGYGACLLHALLGEERGGTYSYGKDDREARQRFSEALRFEHPSEELIAAFTKLLQELRDGGLEFMNNRQIWEKQAGYAAHLRPLFERLNGLEAARRAESEQEIERLTSFCKALPIAKRARLQAIVAQNGSLPASDEAWKAVCTERRSDLLDYFNTHQFDRPRNIERQTAIRASSQRLSEIDAEIQTVKDRFIALARTEEVQTIYRSLILDPDFWLTDNDATLIATLYDLNIHIYKRSGEGYEPALAPIHPNGSQKRVIFWETANQKGHHFLRCQRKT